MVVLLALAAYRRWRAMIVLILVVPGGALFCELLKHLIQRQRPTLSGPFGDWGGYSFPSGHTICATLVYGGLALWASSRITSPVWRKTVLVSAAVMIVLVALQPGGAGSALPQATCWRAILLGLIWLKLCTAGTTAG